MTMTIKKLIKELEYEENKFLEVEGCIIDDGHRRVQIQRIGHSSDKKILIFMENKKDQ